MRVIRLLMLAMLVAYAPAAAAAESKASRYEELVARLQGGDTSVDFQALRFAYAETADFDPYARPVVDRRELIRAINAGRLGDALGLANTILAKNYTDMDAHYASFLVYDQRGDTARAEFHRAVVQGLMKSFADSGDGMSENTAIVVVTEAEEYSYVGLKGYQVVRQGLMPSSAGPVDALAVTTPDNQGTTIYFNISRIFRKLKPASDALPPTP